MSFSGNIRLHARRPIHSLTCSGCSRLEAVSQMTTSTDHSLILSSRPKMCPEPVFVVTTLVVRPASG